MTSSPARIGASFDEIDTPALVVELDAFEHNLRKLADFARKAGVRVRPHAKTHKCPAIALKQIALGAVGASDEHGKLKVGPKAKPLRHGDKVMLIPGHCDPTVNLHDWYVGVRNGRVEALWPIAARGASV